jgi:hypothetical protein
MKRSVSGPEVTHVRKRHGRGYFAPARCMPSSSALWSRDRTSTRRSGIRADPFAEDWPHLEARLVEAAGLEAKTLFEDLRERRPGVYRDGHLRTLQRRVKAWRASRGPEKEIFFPQEHRMSAALGCEMQADGFR